MIPASFRGDEFAILAEALARCVAAYPKGLADQALVPTRPAPSRPDWWPFGRKQVPVRLKEDDRHFGGAARWNRTCDAPVAMARRTPLAAAALVAGAALAALRTPPTPGAIRSPTCSGSTARSAIRTSTCCWSTCARPSVSVRATASGERQRTVSSFAALVGAGRWRTATSSAMLVCDRCGGPRRILGTVTEPAAARRVLVTLGLAAQPPPDHALG